jgi:FkbM family methyltransferase
MKKVFIDGGGNNGNSVDFFLANYPNASEFEIHSFECHPKMYEQLKKKESDQVRTYCKALNNSEGVQTFYLSVTDFGSTLNSTKTTGKISEKNTVQVETVDISKFISCNFIPEDFIVLKLDIEGAEYPVLSKLLETGVIKYIDVLYGEWHQHKVKNVSREEHLHLVKDLADIGLEMKPWDALSKDFKL